MSIIPSSVWIAGVLRPPVINMTALGVPYLNGTRNDWHDHLVNLKQHIKEVETHFDCYLNDAMLLDIRYDQKVVPF